MSQNRVMRVRQIATGSLLAIGVLLLLLAFGAEFVGLDITPGFGLLQTILLLLSITSLTVAAFLYLRGRRGENAPRSLQADIAVRLAATGLVFVYVSGLSDLIQIGTHVAPNFERPYIGPLQQGGIILGVASILAGLLLYNTSRGARLRSSMEFLIQENNSTNTDASTE